MTAAVAEPADPSLELLQQLENRDLWHVVPGIALFDEHDEVDERPTVFDPATGQEVANPDYGRVVAHYGAPELHEIAAASNRGERESGAPCLLTVGHIKLPHPEGSPHQPDHVGFVRNFRVGRFGPQKKLAVLGDYWIWKDQYPSLLNDAGRMKYPHRSVELYQRDNTINPVALLVRRPARDLGVVLHSSESRPESGDWRCPDGRVRYSMDDYEATAMTTPTTPATPPAPAQHAMSDADVEQMAARIMQYLKADPVYQYAAKQYGASCASGGNTFVPGGPAQHQQPAAPAQQVPAPAPAQHAAETEAQRIAREQAATHAARVDAELQALREANARLVTQYQRAERERELVQLDSEGYHFDRKEMLDYVAPMTPEQYSAWQGVFRKTCGKRPGGPVVQTNGYSRRFIDTGAAPREIPEPVQFSAEQKQQCLRAVERGEYKTFEEAYTKMFRQPALNGSAK